MRTLTFAFSTAVCAFSAAIMSSQRLLMIAQRLTFGQDCRGGGGGDPRARLRLLLAARVLRQFPAAFGAGAGASDVYRHRRGASVPFRGGGDDQRDPCHAHEVRWLLSATCLRHHSSAPQTDLIACRADVAVVDEGCGRGVREGLLLTKCSVRYYR